MSGQWSGPDKEKPAEPEAGEGEDLDDIKRQLADLQAKLSKMDK
jgi:hypothetical protein